MSNDSVTQLTRLNPRTRRVQDAILDAAIDVLLERGAHEVTASRVAERADVARTTVYRHWPDQRSLLLATVDALTAPHHPSPVEGSLDTNLHTALRQLRTRLVTHNVVEVFGALAAHAARDTAFSDGQRRFVEQLTQPTLNVLTSAQGAGVLDDNVDCWLEATLLAGPVLHRHLSLHAEISDAFIDEVISRWLAHQRLS